MIRRGKERERNIWLFSNMHDRPDACQKGMIARRKEREKKRWPCSDERLFQIVSGFQGNLILGQCVQYTRGRILLKGNLTGVIGVSRFR